VRAFALDRATDVCGVLRCDRCGRAIGYDSQGYSLQHRKARGAGGSGADINADWQNFVVLCGSSTTPNGCHDDVEHQRRKLGEDTGFVIGRNNIILPSDVPILRHWREWVIPGLPGSDLWIPAEPLTMYGVDNPLPRCTFKPYTKRPGGTP
jgi:hypothetical protein